MVNKLEKWQRKSQKISQSTLKNSIENPISLEKLHKMNERPPENLKDSSSVEQISQSPKEKPERKAESISNETRLPKIESAIAMKLSIESPYTYGSNIKFPDINEGKKKEKELLNEENFVIDENNLFQSLKEKIDEIFTKEVNIESFTKKALFYGKIVDTILCKMNKRINFIDSVLFKKNKHLVLFRKETSIISKKIQSIKTLVFLIILIKNVKFFSSL